MLKACKDQSQKGSEGHGVLSQLSMDYFQPNTENVKGHLKRPSGKGTLTWCGHGHLPFPPGQ